MAGQSEKAILEKLELSEQSLRLFSWEKDLADITVHHANGTQKAYEGFGNNWHYHPELELNLMLEGEGMLFVGDYIGQFQAPDVILLGANLPHYWRARSKVKGIALQFLDTHHAKTLPAFMELSPLLEQSRYGLRLKRNNLDTVFRYLHGLKSQTALGRFADFLSLLVKLNKNLTQCSNLSSQAINLASTQDMAMSLVIDHVLQNFDKPISLQDALAISNLSRASFHRQFKRMTGTTFTHYVNNVRLQEAKRLVLETDLAITNIAFDTGFRNLSHFNALFKKQFMCSPRTLR